MAKTLKDHTKVDANWVHGDGKQVVVHDFALPAAQVWKSLLDADAWTHWLPITKVTWTSPEPFSVGTTRTVEVGKDVIEEVFHTWEDGRRMGFYFDKSSLPVSALAEDYLVEETENGSRLTWTFRVAAFPLLKPVLNGQLKKGGRQGLPKLEQLIASEPERFS